jgi:quercetin dioxygenase-like cupin family protein
MFILSGQIEVEAGGEVRRFSAGDIVLAEDTEGPGHATTSLEDTVIANVRV